VTKLLFRLTKRQLLLYNQNDSRRFNNLRKIDYNIIVCTFHFPPIIKGQRTNNDIPKSTSLYFMLKCILFRFLPEYTYPRMRLRRC